MSLNKKNTFHKQLLNKFGVIIDIHLHIIDSF